MMRVFFERRGARTVQRKWSMAVETQHVSGFAQLRVVVRAMHVVTAEAGHAAAVHHALHKIISLHTIFVRGALREVREGGLAKRMVFQLPEITQI